MGKSTNNKSIDTSQAPTAKKNRTKPGKTNSSKNNMNPAINHSNAAL